jgi:hypothetical protein
MQDNLDGNRSVPVGTLPDCYLTATGSATMNCVWTGPGCV